MRICSGTAGFLLLCSSFSAGSGARAQDQAIDSTVTVCAVLRPQVDRADELRRSLLALVTPTHAELGNIAYDVHETGDGTLFLYEAWRSQSDLDQHLQRPYVVDFVARMDGLLAGGNDAHFGRIISSAGKPAVDDMHEAVHICSFKRPKEGKADALRDALLSLTEPTSSEEGYLTYNLYEEKNGALFLYEVWRSQADLERHFQTSYVLAFRARVDSLADDNRVYIGRLISEDVRSDRKRR